jgi:Zn-finger nucleic acid-binding protein
MKCPVCKKRNIQPAALENGLPAGVCAACGGKWISSNRYLDWLRLQTDQPPQAAADEPFDPTWDTDQLKLCPECGRILTRYRILPGVPFALDRCGSCQGVWFDHHEWEALRAHNLQLQLNQFFTHPWQDRLHKDEKHARMDAIYLQKFGQADYDRVRQVREWIWAHPLAGMLIAFLQAEDPYS